MVISVAAPDVAARKGVATGGLSAAPPPALLPSAAWPSEHASARTSAPRRVSARRGLIWDIFSILNRSHRGSGRRPPRANARSGCWLKNQSAAHSSARRTTRAATLLGAVKNWPRVSRRPVTSPPVRSGGRGLRFEDLGRGDQAKVWVFRNPLQGLPSPLP